MIAACREKPCSASDLLPVLFRRKLDLHQTTFAMGEAVAHLHALAGMGRLRGHLDADGIRRFSVVEAPGVQHRTSKSAPEKTKPIVVRRPALLPVMSGFRSLNAPCP